MSSQCPQPGRLRFLDSCCIDSDLPDEIKYDNFVDARILVPHFRHDPPANIASLETGKEL